MGRSFLLVQVPSTFVMTGPLDASPGYRSQPSGFSDQRFHLVSLRGVFGIQSVYSAWQAYTLAGDHPAISLISA